MPKTSENILCVIPARMGSTRIKHKNLQEIDNNLSLIQQAIETASGLEICISTDKPEMISVDPEINLIKRPFEISDNKSQITPSISHALKEMELRNNKQYQIVVVLMPSIAARSSAILKNMLELIKNNSECQSIMTAAKSPQWIWKFKEEENIAEVSWLPNFPKISQDLPPYLAEHASIIINKREVVKNDQKWELPLILYELPSWSVGLDIDNETDLKHARIIYKVSKSLLDNWNGNHYLIKKLESISND